ncbi:hypothetical protein MMC25_002621 [Agyrium rufum]|nr:hypothetical protein [Agyrium rufum]
MSTVTACIISVLAQAESQLILHFCALLTVANPGMSEEESGLISLLYSLISQLVFHLKSALESSIDLSDERFSRLDGTMTTWSVALCLFEDLVSLSLPYVICVIDGIEWSITDVRRLDFGTFWRRYIRSWKERRIAFSRSYLLRQTLMDVLDAESIFCESEIGQTRNSPFKQTGKGMMPLTEL